MEKLIITKIDSKEVAIQVAPIVIQAIPEYYDIFGLLPSKLYLCVASQIVAKNTELSATYVATNSRKDIIGVLSMIHTDQLEIGRTAGALMLLSQTDTLVRKGIIEKLKDFGGSVPKISIRSMYLARIAIDKEWRGRGFGKKLLHFFIKSHPDLNLSLHVRTNNTGAINLYTKNGFRIIASSTNYSLMLHETEPPTQLKSNLQAD